MWEAFCGLIETVLEWIANLCGDWGLAIIILTFIIRLALLPLSIKQVTSTTRMSLMSGRMQEIQSRYANDPQRQAEEMRRFYSENDVNPIGGCLPLILQMPIFFALFTVLKGVSADASFYGILPSLATSAKDAVGAMGIAAASAYVITDLLFGVLTLIPIITSQQGMGESTQGSQMKVMAVGMALLMVWVGWSLPAGVNLYYVTSSAWGVIQQLLIANRVKAKILAEEAIKEANAPIHVEVMRRERKKRPHKKS